MASKSSVAIRQAQAAEAIGQGLAALNERMDQIEQRLGTPIEAKTLTLIESEPPATAAQVAELNTALNAVYTVLTGLNGAVAALAEQMSRIEARLDSRPAQPQAQHSKR